MAIYDILAAHRDQRDGGDICSFNGYLEDYLGIIEEDETKKKETEVLRYLHTLDENLRVCTDQPRGDRQSDHSLQGCVQDAGRGDLRSLYYIRKR